MKFLYLNGQFGDAGIGQTLRNDHETNGQSGYQVTHKELGGVLGQPF